MLCYCSFFFVEWCSRVLTSLEPIWFASDGIGATNVPLDLRISFHFVKNRQSTASRCALVVLTDFQFCHVFVFLLLLFQIQASLCHFTFCMLDLPNLHHIISVFSEVEDEMPCVIWYIQMPVPICFIHTVQMPFRPALLRISS